MNQQAKPLITVSSIARIAGNIAAGMAATYDMNDQAMLEWIAERSVKLARLIANEVTKDAQ